MRLSLLGLLATAGVAGAAPPDAAKLEFFEKKVRPVLVGHCNQCHSADTKPAGNLRVDDHHGLLTGGNGGPAVVPGQPEKSLLLKRVAHDAKKQMPAEGEKLSPAQIADLTQWVKDGAVWPAVRVPATLGKGRPGYDKLRAEHWAFKPVANAPVPAVTDAAWPRDDIDRFVLAALDAKGLKPVGDADPVTLVRRVTFDLTGLPPTPAEVDAFVRDPSLPALVDRLLAAPAFGERWGRHWLDAARYGESTGPSRNIPYPHAWRYRDYVIDAVNADVPFDRFVREQLAGDLLAAATDAERDRLRTATGFLALGVKDVNQRFKVRFEMDNVDEQIDAVTRSTIGLTVSCARCHDHKFDPIPTTDYYALAGIFTSTDATAGVRNKMGGGGLDYYAPDGLVRLSGEGPAAPPAVLAKAKAELDTHKKAWDAIRGTPEGLKKAADGQPTQRPFRLKFEKAQADYQALTDPAARGYAVHGAREGKVADTEVRLRGEAEKRGPVVPRGFLTAFPVPGAAAVTATESGRRELADWLVSPNNPLTARVAVNRVWLHLFGRGLVNTPDNFGVMGDTPSHPELLDHLAGRFVRDGWSLKRLVRTLVLTRAYGLSSEATPAHRTADPGNVLLWRHTPRRLEAEELRDAVLASAGTLDRSRPEGSPARALKMIEMRDNGPEAKGVHEAADRSRVRSVYLPLLRGVTPKALEVFDPADQTLVTVKRDTTTVPGQALFLLNSPFVRRNALALADRLLAATTDDAERVTTAYRLTLGRSPSQAEVERALGFVGEYESAYRAEPRPLPAVPRPAAPRPKGPTPEVIDPDQIDQTGEAVTEDVVRPRDSRTAAWLALTQALYGSAEFRYVK
ncbi:PSD1 and planctomycete cytochrome C domain-containing protein [Urbifossiella limnaea]|uniref:Planctomycete cytochrome C n=1 Tax=Urbifossiella limnaea TaxID=2528023 RepID=A0A517Y325_9BACT|nr:PSD1 and planctomycete cytochrome C domain-containing protein [Urbifossiella limnaea]QDU24122.1 Planctomycete cytochrome C [Urbifossiella limnaea]